MMVQQVALLPYSSSLPAFILSSCYCLCRVLHVLPMSPWVSSRFSGFVPHCLKHASKQICYAKLPLGVNE